ncbi:MAG: hypothetical protein RR980_01505, partial [Mucinivorans sp.]
MLSIEFDLIGFDLAKMELRDKTLWARLACRVFLCVCWFCFDEFQFSCLLQSNVIGGCGFGARACAYAKLESVKKNEVSKSWLRKTKFLRAVKKSDVSKRRFRKTKLLRVVKKSNEIIR